jgi:hypothetical protein
VYPVGHFGSLPVTLIVRPPLTHVIVFLVFIGRAFVGEGVGVALAVATGSGFGNNSGS